MNILAKYQLLFTCIGLLNNIVYIMALSSSQDVATHFNEESLMSLVGFMLIFPTSLMLILNSVCFLRISHRKRVLTMVCLNAIACVLYAIFSGYASDQKYAFYICLVVSVLIGVCQTLGEGVIVSFIKKFDSRCIAGWSSGTGFAGIIGSGLYLLLKSFNIFYSIAPLEIVYAALFIWLESHRPSANPKVPYRHIVQVEKLIEEQSDPQSDKRDRQPSLNFEKPEELEPHAGANMAINSSIIDERHNVVLNCTTIKPIFKKIWWSWLNIGLVYFFEYAILVGFADVLTRQSNIPLNPNFFQKNAYKILSFMYQIGVTISRSSMYCFKIEKWHILTIIQGLNFAGWFVLAAVTTGYIYVEFGWMVWVGLMGGCSYVNIYYFTLELNKSLQIEQKELAVNLIILSTDIFSTLATILAVLLSRSLFKQ